MNREEKRKLNASKKKSNKGPRGKINLKKKKNDDIYIPEGTKVKLNLKRIQAHPEYSKYTEAYTEFSSLSICDSFISGFRLGAKFAYNTFVD